MKTYLEPSTRTGDVRAMVVEKTRKRETEEGTATPKCGCFEIGICECIYISRVPARFGFRVQRSFGERERKRERRVPKRGFPQNDNTLKK